VSQCEENPGCRASIRWLKNHPSRVSACQLRQRIALVRFCNNRHSPIRRSDLISAIERVLEHGPRSDKGAVLLWLVVAQPLLNQGSEPFTVTSRQNDRPNILRWVRSVHYEISLLLYLFMSGEKIIQRQTGVSLFLQI
jgi:hypothetical protein